METSDQENQRPGQTVRNKQRSGIRLLLFLTVLPGTIGVVIFFYYALVDWAALQKAYANYSQVVASGADLRAVFVAESAQNIHRINLFAEGVWALLAAILAAIGLHGIVARKDTFSVSAHSD